MVVKLGLPKNKFNFVCLKRYSLKLIEKRKDDDVQNEVNLLKRLGDHENILKFHEFFCYNSFFCIVTEYCQVKRIN